jgi:hypothetical protein
MWMGVFLPPSIHHFGNEGSAGADRNLMTRFGRKNIIIW